MNTQTLVEFCREVAAAGSFDALTDDQKALLLMIEANTPKTNCPLCRYKQPDGVCRCD
jgi:hypothetical protein